MFLKSGRIFKEMVKYRVVVGYSLPVSDHMSAESEK